MIINNCKLIIVPIVILMLLSLSLTPTLADKFSNAYLRLNNQSANASVDAVVCIRPSSTAAGVENKVTATFPDGFTISSDISNWITGVANLPEGSTPWPGISTNATAISGKSVTFSSSDLTVDVLYCFNVSSSSSNNGSVASEETGTIETRNSSNTIIDSTTYATSILDSNQIAVTAWIRPHVSDLPISITSNRDNVTQNTDIEYTITYGIDTIDSFPLTIQAQWSQGSVENAVVPSVDIVDYVVGSATDAVNLTPPIIDTINRTITWDISSLGNTMGKTVTFKLKTNDNYQGANKVNFDVSARAISGSVVTPDAITTGHYHYAQPTSSLTPTPTPIAVTPENPLEITNIDITSVSQSTAQIMVSTNYDSLLNFKYGTTANSLINTIKTLKKTKTNLIDLDKLEPNTNYYFRVYIAQGSGKIITSDIFTFKTAVVSPIPSVNTQTIIATSKDNLLINTLGPTGSNISSSIIMVPTASTFSVQFALNKPISLKTIQAIIRNKKVLGFSTTEKAQAATNYVNLVEIQPGVYAGKLDSPKVGQYEIYTRLIDFNGNILEQKIADLLVTQKFQVLEKGTKNPVENARVELYIYNQTTKTYSVISSQILPIENPSFTSPQGALNLVLPYGIYKADISAIGYGPQTVEFEINPYAAGDYPTVYLQGQGFNIFNTISYYSQIASDALTASQTYLRDHADSSRLFNLVTTGALFIFVLVTLIAFSAKTHVSLLYLPYFFAYKLRLLVKKEDPLLLVGKIEDKITKLPVSKAIVYLQNPKTGHVEVTLRTNKLGEFYYEEKKDRRYQVYVMKKGFITPAPVLHQNKGKQEPIVIGIQKLEEVENLLLDTLIVFSEDILGTFLEFLIMLGFIFEFYFVATFGLLRTAPFMLISILTFALLLIYIYKPRVLK
jgi:hypothetical protein